MVHDVVDRDPLEIIYLATAQDGGYHLVLFRGGQDKNGVGRRFLERLEECVEGLRSEHVHLIDHKHAIASRLRRHGHLVDYLPDIVDAVVGGGIKLHQIIRISLGYGHARLALSAGLPFGRGMQTIDCTGKDTCARGLADSARAAEQIGLRQPARRDRTAQRGCQLLLPHYAAEGRRPVLARTDYVFVAHRYFFEYANLLFLHR